MAIKLTRLELEIMDFFWRYEEASVREVFESIPVEKRPAFTTVQTITQRLEQKGALVRTGKNGNALFFKPMSTATGSRVSRGVNDAEAQRRIHGARSHR